MDKIQYVTSLRAVRHIHKHIYTSGKLLTFSNNTVGYIKRGGADFLYRGNVISAKEGALIYIPCGTQYYSVWNGEPDIEFYQIVFDFSSKLAFSEYPFCILEDYQNDVIEKIMEEYNSDSLLAIGTFYELLSDIYKKMKVSEKNEYKDISPAVEYIEKNYTKPIRIEYLAGLCNISSPALFKKFKEYTGVSPISYKHNVLIQHALDLLSTTELSVEEISERLGFSSPNYFRTVFIKIAKKSPKHFRN